MERCNVFSVMMTASVVIAAWLFWSNAEYRGGPRFFADQSYHFQTLRALNDVAAVGGDVGETLQAIVGLRFGNAQRWYAAWSQAGDRVAAFASRTADRFEKGNALLRAHTYHSTADFFSCPAIPGAAKYGRRITTPLMPASMYSISNMSALPPLTENKFA